MCSNASGSSSLAKLLSASWSRTSKVSSLWPVAAPMTAEVLLLAILAHSADDILFAGEVAVHRSWAKFRLPADVLHSGLVEALPCEASGSSVQNLLAPSFEMGFSYFRHWNPQKERGLIFKTERSVFISRPWPTCQATSTVQVTDRIPSINGNTGALVSIMAGATLEGQMGTLPYLEQNVTQAC